jgi:hypothetical protein
MELTGPGHAPPISCTVRLNNSLVHAPTVTVVYQFHEVEKEEGG